MLATKARQSAIGMNKAVDRKAIYVQGLGRTEGGTQIVLCAQRQNKGQLNLGLYVGGEIKSGV